MEVRRIYSQRPDIAKTVIAITLVLLFFGSCVSLKTPGRQNLVPLKTAGLIGRYPVRIEKEAIVQDKKVNIPTVIWYFFKNTGDPDSLELRQSTHIELQLTDKRHLTSILYKDNLPLKTNTLKGRLKNGYFRRRTRVFLMGVPPFYWSLTSVKMQFGISDERQLFIDDAQATDGGILIVLAGTPGLTSSITVPAYIK